MQVEGRYVALMIHPNHSPTIKRLLESVQRLLLEELHLSVEQNSADEYMHFASNELDVYLMKDNILTEKEMKKSWPPSPFQIQSLPSSRGLTLSGSNDASLYAYLRQQLKQSLLSQTTTGQKNQERTTTPRPSPPPPPPPPPTTPQVPPSSFSKKSVPRIPKKEKLSANKTSEGQTIKDCSEYLDWSSAKKEAVDINMSKNQLQEIFQKRLGSQKIPEYVSHRSTGSEFYVSVDVTFVSDGGKHTTGYGRATTKKDAEKLAALDALIKLKKQKESAPTTTPAEVQGKNPKAQLNELYQKLWKTCPHYKFNHSDGMYIAEVQVEDSVFLGKGGSKATASVEAARSALAYLAQTKPLTRRP